ncbi:MAG TPA: TonB-dependent receptor [Rhizomicrobium sp.]|jgi:iron complex outermembrane receptor protein|nr:TonB-dependent receptor [Rhizomicrobium sp.]
MTMRTVKSFLLGASALSLAAPLLLASGPAFAASTGDQAVEMVTVTAQRTSVTGLVDEHVSKQRSTITQAFFDTQSPGQTIFQGLNMVPGLNFTNTDPYGASGGDLRLHGQDGARISFTWDGMPLNDTGNYAIFTNQVVDPELVDSVIVNQGTTDVDTPTASAVGGVIGITTTKPSDVFQAMADLSYGSFNQERGFARLDSGTFGPWDTKALLSYSYQNYDKFKGAGHLQKQQINGFIYQDLGAVGFFDFGFHFNQNRNNFYNNVSYLPAFSESAYSSAVNKNSVPNPSPLNGALAVGAPNVALDANGDYTGVITPGTNVPIGGFGMNFDEDPTCTRPAAVAGTAQNEATSAGGTTGVCTGFYKLRINPSDTGNIRAQSLFHLNDSISLTVDPSFQYVLANGGGVTVINERDPRLKGTSGALGVDLNGDGDTLDAVQVYSPNNTNTRRYGLTTSVIWAPNEENVLQVAYTLDYGLHRQTGEMELFNAVTGPVDPFGGLREDHANAIRTADGLSDLRQRDRKSYAILNQASLDYEGKYWNDTLLVSVGLRLPFLERDLNQFCYVQAQGAFSQTAPGVGFQYCTTETPSAVAPNGTVTFAGLAAGTTFTPPGHETVRYNRLLPNLGLTYQPFGPQSQFFFAYATELSAPKTDNLYNGGVTGFNTPAVHFSSFATVMPETSTSYDLGYRYHGDNVHASITVWNSQFRNRIVTTFDPDQGISIDHNLGTVNMAGMDLDAGYDVDESLSLFGTFSYLKTRVVNDLALGNAPAGVVPAPFYTAPVNGVNTLFAPTSGKQLVESPNYMATARAQYTMWGFRVGLDGKFVGSRFATDVNDYKVPSYFTANADITYDLGQIGWDNSYVKFNVENLFDAQYFGSVGTSRSCFTPVAPTVSGCTSYPLLSVGFPRTFEVTLRSVL